MGASEPPGCEKHERIVVHRLADGAAGLFFEKGGGRLRILNLAQRFLDALQRVDKGSIALGSLAVIGERFEERRLIA